MLASRLGNAIRCVWVVQGKGVVLHWPTALVLESLTQPMGIMAGIEGLPWLMKQLALVGP